MAARLQRSHAQNRIALYGHRVRAERQRGTPARGRRGDGATRSAACTACACSTTRPTPRTTGRCSRSPATPPASSARCSRCSSARSPTSICGRIAASIRGWAPSTSCPFVPIEGVTMAECVALARKVGAAVADASTCPSICTRRRRRNPARKNLEDIRRGEFEGLAAKMAQPGVGTRLRPAAPHPTAGASVDRRADAAHRLQHQPGDRSARRREEDRRRHPPQQRRLPVREGDGHRARGPRHRPGLDEPDELREDADLPGLRDRQARGRALRRGGARKRDRRPGPVGRARRRGRVLPADRRTSAPIRCSRTSSRRSKLRV